MVSESVEVQVLVRAMYDFESEDATNLTFKKDDVIQVLAQLESGWWAGHCDGRQGWFPSNYVQVLTEDDYDSQDDADELDGDDLDSADDLWLPQTTPDGQVFYYNQRTHESSWTIPEQEDQASTTDQDGTGKSKSGWSVRESTSNGNGWYNSEAEDDEHDYDDDNQDHAHEASGRVSRASSINDQKTSEITGLNGSTSDPTQSLTAVRKPSGLVPVAPQESVEGLPPLPLLPNPFDPEPTWQSLSEHTSAAVQNLIESSEKGYKPYYLIQSSIVVEAIRVMLYASGTVDKDTAIMRQHRDLKIYHRQIMAALSKLVLSAKMASGVWPQEGAVSKLQADAGEVAIASQNYIAAAMAASITVHQVDARLVTDVKSPLNGDSIRTLERSLSNGSMKSSQGFGEPRKVFGSQMNSQSILSQLEYYSKSATKSVNVLAMQIEKLIETPPPNRGNSMGVNGFPSSNPIMNSSQSAQLVTQARQSISQLGSLLTLVNDFSSSAMAEQPAIPERYFTDVKVAKQALHGSTASLVMAIQSATDLLASGQTLDLALSMALAIDRAAQTLVQSTRILIQEKEMADATSPRPQFDPYNAPRKASIAPPESVYTYDNDSDIEPDLAPRSTISGGSQRNRSDSQPSIFSGHSTISGPQTPGLEHAVRGQSGSYFPPPPASESTLVGSTHSNGANYPSQGRTMDGREKQDKLKKILGDDAPSRPSAQPWFLEYDYSKEDVILNSEGQVKGGTLPALIERLTLHDGVDMNFIATFLLSYRSFTNTKELFQLLFHRFTIQAPLGVDQSDLELWTEKKQTPIRLRVFNIMKSWLENYYLEDETDDREALAMIKEFSGSAAMKDTMSFAAVQLIKLVEKREQSEGAFRKMVLNLSTQAPQPITPRNLKKIKFLELDPLEFARQLTIMEASVYNKIRPVECLAKAWTSEDPDIAAKAVNIKKMIETSNLYANWINELLLSEKEIKKRVVVIRHLVAIAEKLRHLNNFSMLSTTMAALSQSPIHRLKRTWEQVPNRTMTSFMELQALMGVAKNWVDYRIELHKVNPPCVPFVGMYLTDLVMIQDGNSDYLKKSSHLINFYKRVKTAEVIREIQQYQSVPYCLTPVPEIQTFIRRGLDSAKSVADLYEMSLLLEPRERGDEKIARMLTESGML
ncbi:hypothetical protein BGW38_000456 [Lunasporangiospora selenospora]|uniref:Ras guanine nucleotide exchange factor domain-containing protein n=1 Tax=Lunasporangiospora selenospora TaxID=979761 RepID=A0A9P6FV28_9FUNG|nr:hypothetical protein BGW38_000456 [Lunasporangiospora selenospora]